jgi:hypothetical protein
MSNDLTPTSTDFAEGSETPWWEQADNAADETAPGADDAALGWWRAHHPEILAGYPGVGTTAPLPAWMGGTYAPSPSVVPQVTPPDEEREPLYVDIAALLSGELPEPPKPDLLSGTLYAGKYNMLFGDSGAGKTWVALAAVVEHVNSNRLAVVVDMDHNGAAETVARLMPMGATPEALAKPELFRYAAPGDWPDLDALVADLVTLDRPLVVLDSIQELMAAYGKDSNKDDDFTWVYQRVIKPLLRAGATVVSIDHLAKSEDSRRQGPSGAVAKRRVIDGASLRAEVTKPLVKGAGGRLALVVDKDRHGGLGVPRGKGVASFELRSDLSWQMWPATPIEQDPEELPELPGSTEVRIRAFLTEADGEKFMPEQIGRATKTSAQKNNDAAIRTVRSTLSRLFKEGTNGAIQREHVPNSTSGAYRYWIDPVTPRGTT